MPTYFQNGNPDQSIRSKGFVFYNGTPLWGAWQELAAFQTSGASGIATTPFSGTPLVSGFGFSSISSDNSNGAILASFAPTVTTYTSAGAITSYSIPTSGALLHSALVVSGETSAFFAADVSGNVYTLASGASAVSLVGSFGQPTMKLAVTGTTLFTIFSGLSTASGLIGTFNLTTSAVGATLTPPMTHPRALASSGSLLAVAGWSPQQFPAKISSISQNPTNGNIVAVTPFSGNIVSVYTSDASGNWALTASAASSGAPSVAGWTPLGNTLFTSDATSGLFQIFSFSASALSLSQVLSVAGAGAFGVTTDSLKALVAQPTHNTLTPVTLSGASWIVSGATLPLTGATALLGQTASNIAVGFSSGIATYTYNSSGVFTQTASSNPGFAVTAITEDNSNNLVYGGASGTSGFVVCGNGTANFTASGLGGIVYARTQIAALSLSGTIPNIGIFSDSSVNGIGVALQNTINGISGIPWNSMYPSPSGVFLLNATNGAAYVYQFTAPFTLAGTWAGSVAVLSGATWASTVLTEPQLPEALAFDVSGNLTAFTLQNNYYSIAPSGGIISSGSVAVFFGQLQSASLGISVIKYSGTTLYGTSSQNESFIQLFP